MSALVVRIDLEGDALAENFAGELALIFERLASDLRTKNALLLTLHDSNGTLVGTVECEEVTG